MTAGESISDRLQIPIRCLAQLTQFVAGFVGGAGLTVDFVVTQRHLLLDVSFHVVNLVAHTHQGRPDECGHLTAVIQR